MQVFRFYVSPAFLMFGGLGVALFGWFMHAADASELAAMLVFAPGIVSTVFGVLGTLGNK